MKLLIIALAVLSTHAFAAPKLCPQGTTPILTCISNDIIAMYPYVAICEDQNGIGIVLDPGAGRTPESMDAVASETETAMIYTATEADADGLTLTHNKNVAGKKNSTLSFTVGPIDGKLSFNCK